MSVAAARNSSAAWAVGLACLSFLACQGQPQPTPAQADKVPITTSSDEARQAFLQGRELVEKLHATDARSYYRQAVQQDPDFALAHLGLANTSPGFDEFFDSLKDAVSAAERQASQGERHQVLAARAGADGDVEAQDRHLTALVEMYPDDERARNLLGTYHFGRQEFEQAIEHYERATSINPDFSPPYNQMGYAYRALGQYDKAESAFQSYIQRIPDEPNPYDSYAELLMKLGRYQESIDNYRKALDRDPNFIASYVGIGNNQILLGQPEAARETFAKLGESARNDGERRQALLWTASSYLHEGEPQRALEVLQQRYAVAEQAGDFGAMGGDLVLAGTVLLETGSPGPAMESFGRALEAMDKSSATEETKRNFRRNQLYREARVAIARGDLAAATSKTEAYGAQVAQHRIPFEVRQHHELLGTIAMEQKDFAAAVDHLTQANQRSPRILYLAALAHQGKGDEQQARQLCERAANFNEPAFGWAYVRAAARQMLERG